MNTIRSTWIGWGTLCLAGGGSYYFAKRQINADRQARHQEELRKRQRLAEIEFESSYSKPKKQRHKPADHAANPSAEASKDPAPTDHIEKGTEVKKVEIERSKYEPKEPYRAKKGDRFS